MPLIGILLHCAVLEYTKIDWPNFKHIFYQIIYIHTFTKLVLKIRIGKILHYL